MTPPLPVRNPCISALLAAVLPAAWAVAWAEPVTDPAGMSLPELEKRLPEIDAELAQLAHSSLRSGVGSIGYRSKAQPDAGSPEWVQVAFDRPYPIDEIVLVPTLGRDSKKGIQADGFPEAFRVVAGTGDQDEGTVIASYDASDRLLPRIAPVVIPVNRTTASWVRIEATQLTRRTFDGRHVLQFSELMVFNGPRNVALRQPVTASSVHRRDLGRAWALPFLVDGHTPYLMDAAQGEPSIAYIGAVSSHDALILDLGEAYPLSEIHLHAVDQSDTVPQAYQGNLGVPPTLLVEGATTADFSDAATLLELNLEAITDTGPVMMWPLAESVSRYVRIRCPEVTTPMRFGFAEIELFSDGRNVSFQKPALREGQTAAEAEAGKRSPASLTDGRNQYGNLLPIRTWMNQLARRHDLETERPLVAAELNHRYERQKRNLQHMRWLAALLAAGVVITILIDRMLRMRQATRMRMRFAADLHDELGANIHTIGLLGDLARDAGSREELHDLLDRSREFTERSGATIRNWTKKLESRGVCEDLVDDMKVSAASLLADLDHEFSVDGEAFLPLIKPRKRIYIFLFYKECLINILRHSGATRVTTRLQCTPKELTLEVADNGVGLRGEFPVSLKRRARLLRAKATSEKSTEGGTCITLRLKIPRRRLLPQNP